MLLLIVTTIKYLLCAKHLKKFFCVCFVLTQDLSNPNKRLQNWYYHLHFTDVETRALGK